MGQALRKCVFDVCVFLFCFIFVYGLILWIGIERGFTYNFTRVFKCAYDCVSSS